MRRRHVAADTEDTMRVVRPLVAVLAAVAASVLAPAQATAAGCPVQPVTQPFLALGDSKYYFMAPGGTFERGVAPWALSGPTSWSSSGVAGFGGWRSLQLGGGASATSPVFCVDAERPHLRLGAKVDPGARLKVYAVVGGSQRWLATLASNAHSRWAVSREIGLATTLGLVPGQTADVRLRLRAEDGRAWADAVAIDPYAKR